MVNKKEFVYPIPYMASPTGISLRDYFAIEIARALVTACGKAIGSTEVARTSYLIADAMLESKERKENND